mmetsp:Transcript_43099/g.105378  ORF Transcript_43099/g.105378 Transcript_43099/m.105378 type:complete len:231 (-) Transcript_43099:676-1368(-)
MRRPEQSHASLEKELNLIEKTHGTDLVDAPAAVKRRARMIKNRLSAKKSREQAREYVAKLEQTVKVLSAESELLARRLAQVEAENRRMKHSGDSSSSSSSHTSAGRADDATTEEKGQTAEPAALGQPSLQLDALLLLMVASSASGGSTAGTTPSTDALLRLRPLLARATSALLLTKPDWLKCRPSARRARLRAPAPARTRRLMRLPHPTLGPPSQEAAGTMDGWRGDLMQ